MSQTLVGTIVERAINPIIHSYKHFVEWNDCDFLKNKSTNKICDSIQNIQYQHWIYIEFNF